MIELSKQDWFKYLHNNALNEEYTVVHDLLISKIREDPAVKEYTIHRDHNATYITLFRGTSEIYISIYTDGTKVVSFNMEVR